MILYEDAELIVCHKPAGLPVQSARVGQKDMVSILNNHLAQTREGIPSIYVVHRLDQPVEGVLVFAKTKRAAAALSRQVSDGTMKKLYRAVCCVEGDEKQIAERLAERAGMEGQNPDSGFKPGQAYRLVDYLVRDGRTNTSSVAARGSVGAKRAELVFRVVERWDTAAGGETATEATAVGGKTAAEAAAADGKTAAAGRETAVAGGEDKSGGENAAKQYILVEIELKTGRHHQIRVQMAHAGLPLYGDQKYNTHWREFLADGDWGLEGWERNKMQDKTQNETQAIKQNGERTQLALCATSLTFIHPTTGRKMTFGTKPGMEK